MSQDDSSYYRSRAAAEREAAKDAGRADIAEIHQELARLYDALVANEELRPTHIIRTDMGQGSFEESQRVGKGPSRSRQGPKKVTLKNRP